LEKTTDTIYPFYCKGTAGNFFSISKHYPIVAVFTSKGNISGKFN
jgi:hypothetical protein